MYYLESGYGKHNRLRNAVLLALALHAFVLANISFQGGERADYSPQIEVILATRPDRTAPEDARRMAQANQRGTGDESELAPLASRNPALPDQAHKPQQAVLPRPENRRQAQRNTLVTAAASRQAAASERENQRQQADKLAGISPEVDRLNRELASLEAELDEQARSYTDMPRVRRLTSASARQSADAAYLLQWLRRLEDVGNKYYPEASVRYDLYGSLRLLVVIRRDGSLADIQVLSSSGYAVLDEAAIKVVRMAAPFAPFPPELLATTDQLEIIRTWHYENNRLSSE